MKSGIVQIDDRVRSRPLGQKRGKGQPTRLKILFDLKISIDLKSYSLDTIIWIYG